MEEFLSTSEAAAFLGVSASSIRRYEKAGVVSAFITPGGHRRFRRSELEEFVQQNTGSASN